MSRCANVSLRKSFVAQKCCCASVLAPIFLGKLNLKKQLASTEIASSGFVFAIAAGLALAAWKKFAIVKMEHVILHQRYAFARRTGEESAAM